VKIGDVVEHFLSRSPWVDRDRTVDRLIVGDPEEDVSSCVVTWMPSRRAIQRAIDLGERLMICHEPTFWGHLDKDIDGRPAAEAKLAFIREHGVSIVRIHDSWDRWPGIGIPWAWADFLGLEGEPTVIGAGGYQHRYDIGALAFDDFAGLVAERCAAIGEPAVQAVGEGDSAVSKIGIGTGCGCDIATYLDMGCDCSVVCDDGSIYWKGIQMAKDMGHPVIRVNHGTSEEPGMVTLTGYINQEIPGLAATHLPHGCSFRLVGQAPGPRGKGFT
jgi:putative NIF3 family GTP cyclohydrolase 1 type 2